MRLRELGNRLAHARMKVLILLTIVGVAITSAEEAKTENQLKVRG